MLSGYRQMPRAGGRTKQTRVTETVRDTAGVPMGACDPEISSLLSCSNIRLKSLQSTVDREKEFLTGPDVNLDLHG